MLTSLLISKVQDVEPDPDFSEADILALLNEGQLSIAGGGERSHGFPLLAPLPELVSSAVVTLAVDAVSVSMPSTYQRGVFFVTNSSGEKLAAFDSHIEFLNRYPILRTGDTAAYCLQGNLFRYAPTKAHNVTVHFFRFPVDMTDDVASTPDGIPGHLQIRLLVSFALYRMYQQIEIGQEASKPNTDKWFGNHQLALTDLERFIGPEDKEPMNVTDSTNMIDNF